LDFLYNFLDKLEAFVITHLWFAPLSAVLLPFLEAIIPSLPLTVLIGFNLSIMASVFGNVAGTAYTILLSTLGSMAGMILIFGLIRMTLAPYFARKVEENKYGRMFLNVVDGPNLFAVLVILSNPFLPSSILNYALALTKTKLSRYLFLTITSRLVIVTFLVFLGSLFDIQTHPLNILWLFLVYFALLGLWLLWRHFCKKKEDIKPES